LDRKATLKSQGTNKRTVAHKNGNPISGNPYQHLTIMSYDAVIIGGGPAGATTAFYLKEAGLNPLLIEKSKFPRYCVGESLLPYNMDIFQEMGFDQVLEEKGFAKKRGAVFGASVSEKINRIDFSNGLEPQYSFAYQAPRDEFDDLLLKHVKARGVEVLRGIVTNPVMQGEKVTGVTVELPDKTEHTVHAKVVVDASGRNTFLAKKFDLLEADPHIETLSVFGLFRDVAQLKEAMPGDITILAFKHGWFWFIPFADGRTSVGVVVDYAFHQKTEKSSPQDFFNQMIQSASGRVASVMKNASLEGKMRQLQKFSKYATKKAGDGWVSIGDAAMFVDPVYSAGVLVAMQSGKLVANLTANAIAENRPLNAETYIPYEETLKSAYDTVLPFIYRFNEPYFQKLFFNPPKDGRFMPMIVTVLSGCFFKPALIEKDNADFWRIVRFFEIKDKIIGFLTLRWLRS